MTREDIMDRWRQRLSDWTKLGTTVNGERIATEVLADLKAILEVSDDEALGLSGAAEASGYSTRQLSRMIETGDLRNVGRLNAPKVLRKDLPKRAVRSTVQATPSLSLEIARQSIKSKGRGRRNGTQG